MIWFYKVINRIDLWQLVKYTDFAMNFQIIVFLLQLMAENMVYLMFLSPCVQICILLYFVFNTLFFLYSHTYPIPNHGNALFCCLYARERERKKFFFFSFLNKLKYTYGKEPKKRTNKMMKKRYKEKKKIKQIYMRWIGVNVNVFVYCLWQYGYLLLWSLWSPPVWLPRINIIYQQRKKT